MPPSRADRREATLVDWKGWAVAALVAVGVALAALTPVSPWYALTHEFKDYTVENTTFQLTVASTFYPGSDWRWYCSSSNNAPAYSQFCPRTWTQPNGLSQSYSCYATPCGSNDVGSLYSMVWTVSWIILLAGITSMAGILLLLNGRWGWRLTTAVGLALGLTAVASLGLATGVALMQPSAISHVYPASPGSAGPGTSFWSGCGPSATCQGTYPGPNGTSATSSASWGPAVGWFFQLGAGALFLAGALATLRVGLHLRPSSGRVGPRES